MIISKSFMSMRVTYLVIAAVFVTRTFAMEGLDFHYSITAQKSQLSQLGIPQEIMAVLSQENLTSAITTTLATQPFTRSKDNVQIKQGITVEAGINMGSFLSNISQFVPVPTNLLSGTNIRINGPFNAKTLKDLDIRVGSSLATAPNTQEESIKLSGLLKLVELDELPLGDELLAQLDEIDATPTDYSLQYNKGTWRYDLRTNVTLFSIKNVNLNVLIEPATVAHEKKQVAVTIAIPADDFGLSKISEHLAPFDETVTLTNPTITFANYESDTDNTIEGVIIQAIANFGPPFDKLVAPNGKSDTVTITVKIPKTMESAKDVTVNITSSAMQADKICVGDVMSKLGLASDMGPTQELFDKICLTNVIANVRLAGKDSAFEIHGNSNLFGQPQTSTIYLQKRKEGIGVTFASDGRQDTPIKLADIDSKLATFDQTGSLSNWQFAFSNWENPEELLNFGKIAKGFTMTGTMAFTGYVGKFMQIFDLKQDDFLVTIPSGTDISGFKLIIQKPVNKSVGGSFLKFSTLNFGMQFAESTPPVPELMVSLAGIATIPGTPPHPFELEGELAPGEITLSGALTEESEDSQEEKQAPSAKIRIAQSNLYIDKPTVSISLAEGALTGFGGGGILTVGSKQFEVYTKVDAEHPDKMALMFEAEDVGLSDVINIWGAIIGKPVFKVALPSIFSFDKFTAHYAPEEVVMPNMTIEKGFGAEGTMTLFGTTFDILVDYGLFSGITIKAVGDKPMQMSPLLVISDSTGKKGPELDLELTFTNQQAVISGNMQLVKGLISSQGSLLINTSGISATLSDTIAGLTMNMKLNGQLADLASKNFDNWALTGTITNDLSAAINNAIQETVTTILSGPSSAQQQAAQLCQQLFGYLKVFNFDCSSCIASATGLGAMQTLVQQVIKAAQVSVDSITLNTTLGQLAKGNALDITVDITLFGQKETLQVTIDLLKPQNTIEQALLNAVKVVLTPEKVLAQIGTQLASAIKFNCSSSINLANTKATAKVSIQGSDPLESTVQVTIPQLALTDLITIAEQAMQSATGNSLGIPSQLTIAPLTLQNVTLTFTPSTIEIAGSIALFGLQAVAITGNASIAGISLSADLPPLSVPNVLQLTSATDNNSGAQLAITVTPAIQQAVVNGQISLLGGIAQQAVIINLSANPTLTLSGSLAGLGVTIQTQDGLTPAAFTPGQMQLTMTVINDLTAIVSGTIQQILKTINAPFNQAQTQLNKIQDICGQIPVPSCVACAPLGTAQSALSAAQSIVNNATKEITGFALNSITISGTLPTFSTSGNAVTLPQVTVAYTLAGKANTLSLNNLQISGPQDIITAVLNQIFNPSAIASQVSNATKDLISGNLLNNASQILAKAMEDMATCIGENVAKAFKEGVAQAGKAAQQAAQALTTAAGAVGDSINEATQAVNQATQQAEQEAAQAAQKAEQAAEQAVTQAEQQAQQAIEQAVQAAQEAVQKAEAAVKNAVQAAEQAAQKVEEGLKSAGKALSHF